MSRQMKGFADYFMQGLALGGSWAEKWEAQQIARENAKLKAQSDKVRADREERKLGIYAEGVRANAEAARARAYRTMNPVAKGSGKGGAPTSSADAAALRKEAGELGIISAPPAPLPQQNIIVTGGGDGSDGGPEPGVPAPPGEEGGGFDDGDGGSYAEGGIVEGMSLKEAQSYAPSSSSPKKAKPAAAPFSAAMTSAAGKYKAPEEEKAKPEEPVTPRGPVGSGAGGSYTEADLGGVLDTRYRAGGMVRAPRKSDRNIVREPAEDDRGPDRPENDTGDLGNFAEGGSVKRYAKDEDRLIEPKATPGMAEIPVGRGRVSLGANYDPNSRYGVVEGGYEHPVGRNTTLGVHGNIGKDLGPEGASARPDWGVGVRGRVRFQEGGAVDSQDLTRSYDYKAAEKTRETQAQQEQTQNTLRNWEQEYGSSQSSQRRQGGAASSFGSGFESASADGATGSGGDAAGGVSGSGGIGGSATGGQGGSAAAGVGGEDGGTYRGGGRVRKFQSGGRVMEAIDTGMSGPGSGYGQRAAPPARRY